MIPPDILYRSHVLMWASTKEPVEHTGKITLYLGKKKQGKAAFLVIYKQDSSGNYLLEHFDENWITMGASFRKSVEEAKEAAERAYRNISQQWIESEVTEEEAQAEWDAMYKNRFCHFCGQRPDEVNLIKWNRGVICNKCVEGFYQILKNKTDSGEGSGDTPE